ncbi:SpoIIE family protein phosphatase [Streptomyces sp. GC420]|uniref:SpoIIE family protein phosphatase n=1 Tax=Streptomyces sp. GC420 TaxID=2697568 RepID=UPI001414E41F|nr:SpoIIE family protein phosphatase [Streptomyces sp. GC420]NBM14210.1 SpoIIE family protein phosphatase [Streptomyces sp. GC420]
MAIRLPHPATATLDAQGIVTGWSEGARQLLGYRAEEIIGRDAAALLLAERVIEQVKGSLGYQNSWRGRVAVRHRNGRCMDLSVQVLRRTADRGKASEWLLVSPGAGKSQAPLAEAMVEQGFVQAPSILALFDTDLRLERANADTEQAVALTTAQMRGLRLPEIVPDPGLEEAERVMRRVLETGERQEHLEYFLRVPGEAYEHAWSVSLALLRDPAGQPMGVGFEARDTTEQYQARQRLLLLNEASTRIGSALDITRTAQELTGVAVPRLADYVSVELFASLDQGEEPPAGRQSSPIALRHAAWQCAFEGRPEAGSAALEVVHPVSSPPAECLATGRSAIHALTDAALGQWGSAQADWMRKHGFHSSMTVPIRARSATLGVALFFRNQRPEPFEGDDLMLAEEITARAAVCIDNARRYTRERITAEALQQSLLPQTLPDEGGLETASRYLPAGSGTDVGGDWFDVIPLSGTRVALVVGDVVGHGIQAAATMGRLRTAVHTLADLDLPPDELLTHLDDLVIRLSVEAASERGGDIGATCLYAVYDPVSRRCAFASAGHPQPALVTPDGDVGLVEMPVGPPLGLGGLPFETAVVSLPQGSLLALYTDGLVTTRDRDFDEGVDLLCHALVRATGSLDAIGDTVLQALLPTRADDDAALLLVRTFALDPSQVAALDIPADPAAVARTRAWASTQLGKWGLDEETYVTELVVSELVTNAIRHGRPPIRLRLIRNRTLICEVTDASSTTPHMRRARTFDENGRGLLLVAQLTQRWGTRHARQGKTIWAEQPLPARA